MADKYKIGDVVTTKENDTYIKTEQGWALQEPTQTGDTLGEEAKIIGAEIAGSVASQATGAATGLFYIPVAFSGGIASSIAAQKSFGDGEVNYGRALFNGLLTVIPFAPAVRNVTKFSKITPKLIKQAAKTEAKRGAAIGAGYEVFTSPEQEGEITLSDVATGAAIGVVGGITLGTATPYLTKTLKKFVGKTETQINQAIARGDITKDEAIKVLTVGNKVSIEDATEFVEKAIKSAPIKNDVNAIKDETFGQAKDRVINSLKKLQAKIIPSSILKRGVMDESFYLRKKIDAEINTGARIEKNISSAISKNPALEQSVNKFLNTRKVDSTLEKNPALKADLETYANTLEKLQRKLLSQLKIDNDFKNLSKDSQRILRDKIFQSIKDGDYNTREYQIFTNPKFKIDDKLKTAAIKEIATRLKNDSDFNYTVTEANNKAKEHIESLIKQSAANKEGNPFAPYGVSVDGVLKHRREVGEAERKFLGEITAPGEKIRGTLERVSRLVYRNQADIKVSQHLEDLGLAVRNRANDNNFVPLTLKGNLQKDLYVPNYVQNALNDAYLKIKNTGDDTVLLGGYKTAIALSKANKVIMNPPSYFINAYGAMSSALAQGINPFSKNAIKGLGYSLKSDFSTLAKARTGEQQILNNKELRDMQRYGLGTANVITSDIRTGLESSKLGRKVSKAITPVGNVYAASDNAMRYNIWKANQDRLSKIFPNATKEQIKSASAKLTNDTFQNYEKLSPIVRELSRYGFMPQFVAFAAEFTRNIYHQVRFAKQMIRGNFGDELGLATNQANKIAMRKEGVKRLASLVGVVTASEIAREEFNLTAGVTPLEEQALRDNALPEWDRNKAILFTDSEKDENGVIKKVKYMNMTYLIPHTMISDVINAAQTDKPLDEVLDLMYEHFLGDGTFVARTAYNAIQNKDENGRDITNEVSDGKKAKDLFKYFINEAFTPGIIREGNYFVKHQNTIKAGEKPDLSMEEIINRQFGLRVRSVDVEESTAFKIKEYKNAINNVQGKYSATRDNANLSPDVLEKVYNESSRVKNDNMNKLIEINNNLESLGYNEEQRIKILKESKVSSKDIMAILENKVTPLKKEKTITATDVFEEKYQGLGRKEFYQQMRSLYKSGQRKLADSLIKKYKQEQKIQRLKITSKEKLFANMTVEDRASYLIQNQDLYNNYRKKGLVTKSVILEIKRQMKEQND